MTPRPHLRPIAEDDILTVLDLNAMDVEKLAPLDGLRLQQLIGWADRADVLDLGEQLAGFVVTFAPGTDYDGENYLWFTQRFGCDFYYLDRIVIGGQFRRRGLARFVYDAMEERARPFARMVLEVNVEPPNPGSLAFHHGRGYVEIGRRGAPGHVVAMLVKELPGDQ